MRIYLKKWLGNLPWKLKHVLICDLFGHSPALDLEFFKGYTCCDRCLSPLKKLEDGTWSGDFSQLDIMQNVKYDFLMKLRSVEK